MSDRPQGSAARATGAIVSPEVACRCAQIGHCTRPGDGDEGHDLCRWCMTRIDPVYDPCPTLGFGCGPGCDCCTPEQQEAASV